MALQGKCIECNTVYSWIGEVKMSETRCPVHRSPLLATSWQSKLKFKQVVPNDIRRVKE